MSTNKTYGVFGTYSGICANIIGDYEIVMHNPKMFIYANTDEEALAELARRGWENYYLQQVTKVPNPKYPFGYQLIFGDIIYNK